MWSSKPYHRIIDEPSEVELSKEFSIRELIGFTFSDYETNVVNFKMLHVVLHLLAHELNILEQVVDIKEVNRATAIKELQKQQELVLSGDEHISSELKAEIQKTSKTIKQVKSMNQTSDEANTYPIRMGQIGMKSRGGIPIDERSVMDELTVLDKKIKAKRESMFVEDALTGNEQVLDATKDVKEIKDKRNKDKAVTKGKKGKIVPKTVEKSASLGSSDESEDKKLLSPLENNERMTIGTKNRKAGDDKQTNFKTEDNEYSKNKGYEAKTAQQKGKSQPEDAVLIGKYDDKRSTFKTEDEEKYVDMKSKDKATVKSLKGDEAKIAKQKGKTRPKDAVSTGSHGRRASIELATRSQFKLLESNVNQLARQTGPFPMPTMPGNKQLKEDIASGSATLSEGVHVMQVHARVKAAEEGLTRIFDLLSRLAGAGVFPPETHNLINQLHQGHDEVSRLVMAVEKEGKSRSGVPIQKDNNLVSVDAKVDSKSEKSTAPTPVLSAQPKRLMSAAQTYTEEEFVTVSDLSEAVRTLEDEILRNMNSLASKAAAETQKSNDMAKTVAENLDEMLNVNSRLGVLQSLTTDYAKQISGFETCLANQLLMLQEQMAQMQKELKEALVAYEESDRMETTAVVELKKGYELMLSDVKHTIRTSTTFANQQEKCAEDLKKLVHCIEMLREQKADRDEVADGLRDKIDQIRLQMIPDENAFELTRRALTKRLDLCYNKFDNQDKIWANVITELSETVAKKADESDFLDLEDYAISSVNELYKNLDVLKTSMAEPKAALTVKHLPRKVQSNSSTVKAVKESSIKPDSHPQPSPAETPREGMAHETPCLSTRMVTLLPEIREHFCKRRVGGSHTLVTEHTTHEEMALPQLERIAAESYIGIGEDGHSYMLEAELQPCIECNDILSSKVGEKPPESVSLTLVEVGGGDQLPLGEDQDEKVQKEE